MRTTKTNVNGSKGAAIRDPLGTYLKQFQTHLEQQFYSVKTVVEYDQCLAALGNQMRTLSIDLRDLDEETAVDLIGKSDLPPCHAKHNRFMVRRFIRFLVGVGVAKATPETVPADTELGQLKRVYEEYLRRQRGLSERTIFHSWRIAHRFLTFRFGEELGDLSEITAADIAAFLQQVMTRTPPLRDKTLSSHLRNFFRYLFKAGKTATNLASGNLLPLQRKIVMYILSLPGKRRPSYGYALETWNLDHTEFDAELEYAYTTIRRYLRRHGIERFSDLEFI